MTVSGVPVKRIDLGVVGRPKTIGIVGIVLDLLAFLVALPPINARTIYVPIAIGFLGLFCGVWVLARGHKRLGWCVAGGAFLAIPAGALATFSSLGHLETVFAWSALTAATLRFATPLIFAAIGGMFSERSGVVNIGLEGMMLTGCFFGIWGADKTGSWEGGLVIAMVAGGAMALLHAFFAISLRADQIVGGTAINFLAVGITGFLFIDIYGSTGTPSDIPAIPDVHLNFLHDIPVIGNYLQGAFGQMNLMIWLALALVVLSSLFMFRTPLGLRLRSVGEHPRAADTVGISVYRTRYLVGDVLRDARGARRRVSLDRVRALLQPGHERGPRLHRSRRAHLRQVEPVRRARRGLSVRLLQRARGEAARVLGLRGDALPGASVRPDPDRGRRCDRPLDPAGSGWPPVHQAVTPGRAARSRSACSRWSRTRSRS